ncbi:26S proteasome non-ATPase regulatory subunit 5-like [Amphiura filiformis]|uniref:26S proteasome non-ATPase regulatory subunit 5-like n=1 Tax=Amphiura filiformis TaxID=82378 RepID=UPI003B21B45D
MSVIASLLQKLSTTNDLGGVLQELKVTLYSIPPSQLQDAIRNVSFEPVFACFNSTRRQELELGRDILSRMLGGIDPDVVLAQFRDEIYMGMGHPDESIRELCIKQVLRLTESPGCGVQMLASDPDMLSNAIVKVGDDSLGVAKIAISALCNLGKTTQGQELMLMPPMLNDLKKVAAKSDIIRYRVFEIITKIASESDTALQYVTNSGLIQDLLKDLNCDDVLIQLNAAEMLTNLAMCQHGLMYLSQQGIVGRMESMMVEAESDPLQDFLLPATIKFFGHLARMEPNEIIEKHTAFLKTTFNLLSSQDPAMVGVAVDTIGAIGESAAGKRALDKQGQRMIDGVCRIGTLMQQPPTEIRSRTLTAIAQLLQIKLEEQNEDLVSLTEKWFNLLHSKPLDTIHSMCKQPFREIHCPAMSILQAISNQKWAQILMNSQPGFHEYLLDRSTETDKEEKEAKFDVIKALAEAPTSGEIFGRPFLLRLKEFVREGAFYVKVQSEVAFEAS